MFTEDLRANINYVTNNPRKDIRGVLDDFRTKHRTSLHALHEKFIDVDEEVHFPPNWYKENKKSKIDDKSLTLSGKSWEIITQEIQTTKLVFSYHGHLIM